MLVKKHRGSFVKIYVQRKQKKTLCVKYRPLRIQGKWKLNPVALSYLGCVCGGKE